MAYTKKTRITKEPPKIDHKAFATNLDPNLHYSIVHRSGLNGEEDMAQYMDLGYKPATGNEVVKATPFDPPEKDPRGFKIRGDRILMCCPKSEYVKRQKRQADKLNRRVSQKNADKEVNKVRKQMRLPPDAITSEDDAHDTSDSETYGKE